MECFIFAATLYSFTNLMVKYPIRSLITKVSKLLPYSATAQMDSSFIWFWIISTIRSTFLHYKFLFLVICQNIYNLDYWIHHSFSSGLYNLQRNWAPFMRSWKMAVFIMIQQHVLFKRNGLHGLPFSFITRSGKPRSTYRNFCCFPLSLDFYRNCGRFFYHLWWHQRHLVWGHYGQIMVSK